MELSQSERVARLPGCLVLTCGLPASGKSWFGRRAAATLGAEFVQSDVLRRERFGARRGKDPREAHDQGRYSSSAKQAVYEALLASALRALDKGRSIVVDGSFLTRNWRAPFWQVAKLHGAPFCLVELWADEDTLRRRLAQRALDPNEASEADWAVYQKLKGQQEPPTELSADETLRVLSGGDFEQEFGLLLERLERQVQEGLGALPPPGSELPRNRPMG